VTKKAFTLVELVMAIVIMGIIAMISTDIIVKMYDGYIRSNTVNSLQSQINQTLTIIEKRLKYRVKDSSVSSINGNVSTYKKLNDISVSPSHNILEWIGYDNEGFARVRNGTNIFGWSGLIDLDNTDTNKAQFITTGSDLDYVNDNIKALSNGSIDLDNALSGKNAAAIMRCKYNMPPSTYGYTNPSYHDTTVILAVQKGANDKLYVEQPTNTKEYCEQYYLAWSAYAIVPEGADNNDFNLTLKYNYQPWEGETYTSDATSVLLAQHVTTFRFIQLGNTIRIKLCMKSSHSDYGLCQERAIL
jgi:prepilin-type N-terminal cleavage/methylation domain-containing protein